MYNLFDPKIDSIDTVLEIRAKALQLYAQGHIVMEWTGEGTSAKKSFAAPIADILAETRWFLKNADPNTYGFPLTTKKIFRA